MAVLEAWSYGLPVLMTKECNLCEGFAQGAARSLDLAVERMADDIAQFLLLSRQDLRAMGYTAWLDAARIYLGFGC